MTAPPSRPPVVRPIASAAELEIVLALRHEVFVREQGVGIEEERDHLDEAPGTVHLIALAPEGLPVGTARLLAPEPGHEGVVHVGRVAVRRHTRGLGVGRALMARVEAVALERYGTGVHTRTVRVELSAQEGALEFYRALRYSIDDRRYLDAGIWHRDAVRVIRAG